MKGRLTAVAGSWEVQAILRGSRDEATQQQASRALVALSHYLLQCKAFVPRTELRHAAQVLDPRLLRALLAASHPASREAATRVSAALCSLLPHLLPPPAAAELVALIDWPHGEIGALAADVIVSRLPDWRPSVFWPYWVAADGFARLRRAITTLTDHLSGNGGSSSSSARQVATTVAGGGAATDVVRRLLLLATRLLELSDDLAQQMALEADVWLRLLLRLLSLQSAWPCVPAVVVVLRHLTRLTSVWRRVAADEGGLQQALLPALLACMERLLQQRLSDAVASSNSLLLWTTVTSILSHPNLWQPTAHRGADQIGSVQIRASGAPATTHTPHSGHSAAVGIAHGSSGSSSISMRSGGPGSLAKLDAPKTAIVRTLADALQKLDALYEGGVADCAAGRTAGATASGACALPTGGAASVSTAGSLDVNSVPGAADEWVSALLQLACAALVPPPSLYGSTGGRISSDPSDALCQWQDRCDVLCGAPAGAALESLVVGHCARLRIRTSTLSPALPLAHGPGMYIVVGEAWRLGGGGGGDSGGLASGVDSGGAGGYHACWLLLWVLRSWRGKQKGVQHDVSHLHRLLSAAQRASCSGASSAKQDAFLCAGSLIWMHLAALQHPLPAAAPSLQQQQQQMGQGGASTSSGTLRRLYEAMRFDMSSVPLPQRRSLGLVQLEILCRCAGMLIVATATTAAAPLDHVTSRGCLSDSGGGNSVGSSRLGGSSVSVGKGADDRRLASGVGQNPYEALVAATTKLLTVHGVLSSSAQARGTADSSGSGGDGYPTLLFSQLCVHLHDVLSTLLALDAQLQDGSDSGGLLAEVSPEAAEALRAALTSLAASFHHPHTASVQPEGDAKLRLSALLHHRSAGSLHCLAAVLLSAAWGQLGPLAPPPLPLAPRLQLPGTCATTLGSFPAGTPLANLDVCGTCQEGSITDAVPARPSHMESREELDRYADVMFRFRERGGQQSTAAAAAATAQSALQLPPVPPPPPITAHGVVLSLHCPLLARQAIASAADRRRRRGIGGGTTPMPAAASQEIPRGAVVVGTAPAFATQQLSPPSGGDGGDAGSEAKRSDAADVDDRDNGAALAAMVPLSTSVPPEAFVTLLSFMHAGQAWLPAAESPSSFSRPLHPSSPPLLVCRTAVPPHLAVRPDVISSSVAVPSGKQPAHARVGRSNSRAAAAKLARQLGLPWLQTLIRGVSPSPGEMLPTTITSPPYSVLLPAAGLLLLLLPSEQRTQAARTHVSGACDGRPDCSRTHHVGAELPGLIAGGAPPSPAPLCYLPADTPLPSSPATCRPSCQPSVLVSPSPVLLTCPTDTLQAGLAAAPAATDVADMVPQPPSPQPTCPASSPPLQPAAAEAGVGGTTCAASARQHDTAGDAPGRVLLVGDDENASCAACGGGACDIAAHRPLHDAHRNDGLLLPVPSDAAPCSPSGDSDAEAGGRVAEEGSRWDGSGTSQGLDTRGVVCAPASANGDKGEEGCSAIKHPMLEPHLVAMAGWHDAVAGRYSQATPLPRHMLVDARLLPPFADVLVAAPPGLSHILHHEVAGSHSCRDSSRDSSQVSCDNATAVDGGAADVDPHRLAPPIVPHDVVLLAGHRLVLAAQGDFFSVLLSRWGGSANPSSSLSADAGSSMSITHFSNGTATCNARSLQNACGQAAGMVGKAVEVVDAVQLPVIILPEADADVVAVLLRYLYSGSLDFASLPLLACRYSPADGGIVTAAHGSQQCNRVDSGRGSRRDSRQGIGRDSGQDIRQDCECHSGRNSGRDHDEGPAVQPPACQLCHDLRTCARLCRCCEALLLDAPRQMALDLLRAALNSASSTGAAGASAATTAATHTTIGDDHDDVGAAWSDRVPYVTKSDRCVLGDAAGTADKGGSSSGDSGSGSVALAAGCLLTLLLDLALLDMWNLVDLAAQALIEHHDASACRHLPEYRVLPAEVVVALNEGWARKEQRARFPPAALSATATTAAAATAPTMRSDAISTAGSVSGGTGAMFMAAAGGFAAPAERSSVKLARLLCECSVWDEVCVLNEVGA